MSGGMHIAKSTERIPTKNVFSRQVNDITLERRNNILKYTSQALKNISDDKVIYLFGHTFHTEKRIVNIVKKLDMELVFLYSTKKTNFWYKFIPFPSAYNFLIKLDKNQKDIQIQKIFDELDNYSLFELFIFNSSLEQFFINEIEEVKQFPELEYLVSQDSEYFIYGIDMDNFESETGFMEFYSYGVDADKSLTWFL